MSKALHSKRFFFSVQAFSVSVFFRLILSDSVSGADSAPSSIGNLSRISFLRSVFYYIHKPYNFATLFIKN